MSRLTKECLTSYMSGDFRDVSQDDDVPWCIGDIKIEIEDGVEHVLNDVRDARKVQRNLSSLDKLHGNDYVQRWTGTRRP